MFLKDLSSCFKNLQTRDPTASLGSLLPALTATIISLCPTKTSLAATCVYSSLSFHCALLEGSGSICSVALSLGSATLITPPPQPSLLQVKQTQLPHALHVPAPDHPVLLPTGPSLSPGTPNQLQCSRCTLRNAK